MATMLYSRTGKINYVDNIFDEKSDTEVEFKNEETKLEKASNLSKLDIDENLMNIYNTILLKGSDGELSLGSILVKNTNIQYFLKFESLEECDLNNLSLSNIVIISKSNTIDTSILNLPVHVYIDLNNSLKEMREIDKDSKFVI